MLTIRKQERVLKKLIKMAKETQTGVIYKPEHFSDGFPRSCRADLWDILEILQADGFICINYADIPECDNIYTVEVTPAGRNRLPTKRHEAALKWSERIWIFLSGLLTGAAVEWIALQLLT